MILCHFKFYLFLFLKVPSGLTLKQAQEESKESQLLVEFLIDNCEEVRFFFFSILIPFTLFFYNNNNNNKNQVFSFQYLKVYDFPLSRSDSLKPKPNTPPREEKNQKQSTDNVNLTNTQRFIEDEKRSQTLESPFPKGFFFS